MKEGNCRTKEFTRLDEAGRGAGAQGSQGVLRTQKATKGRQGNLEGDRGERALRRFFGRLRNEKETDAVVRQLLLGVVEEMGADSVALWLQNPQGGMDLFYDTSWDSGTSGQNQKTCLTRAAGRGSSEEDLISHALLRGTVMIPDVSHSSLVEREVARGMARRGIQSLFYFLMTFGNESAGVMGIRATQADAFGRRQRQLAELLCDPVSFAVHLMRLTKREESSAVLEERTRIAQEIHDSVAQDLVEIVRRLDTINSFCAADTDTGRSCRSQIEEVQSLARETLAEARRSVWALAPVRLQGGDLLGALKQLAAGSSSQAQVEFSWRGRPRFLPQQVENDLFRICQESLHNALKHANAQRIRIELSYKPGAVEVQIEDDGQGFDVAEANSGRGGFGLISLRRRAKRVGARLAILSEIAGGTRVVVSLCDPAPA